VQSVSALEARWAEGRFVCLGLDPQPERISSMTRRAGIADTTQFLCDAVRVVARTSPARVVISASQSLLYPDGDGSPADPVTSLHAQISAALTA